MSDRIVQDHAYPHGSLHPAVPYTQQWRKFAGQYPYTVPVELHNHCRTHNYDHHLYSSNSDFPCNSLYCIGLGFFSFDIDYYELMAPEMVELVRAGLIKIVFYYHEGDNPENLLKRLVLITRQNRLPDNCFVLVSGNTAADSLDRCVYFPDHELLYWHRNRGRAPGVIHSEPRQYEFTLLSRANKTWRALATADLRQRGILARSQWSYNTELTALDLAEDNPIEIDTLNLRTTVAEFIQNGPYRCDDLSTEEHNDHHAHVDHLYANSYMSIILETHFDVDGSGGAFLTEKTFKCLKHGHPFVLAGGAGSLATLRDLGYRVFDGIIDNTYDTITDNTLRWSSIVRTIESIHSQDMHDVYLKCRPDLVHNQQVFLQSKWNRLNMLFNKIHEKFN